MFTAGYALDHLETSQVDSSDWNEIKKFHHQNQENQVESVENKIPDALLNKYITKDENVKTAPLKTATTISNTKEAKVVVELVHRFDDIPPKIRRWWSDRAAELLAAAAIIRALRPLAHFTSVPYRHAPKAERTNRTASEGTRAALIQSGLDESWWPLALLFWIAMWNGFVTGPDGMTPYFRRHNEKAPYKQYAFGALVLYHPVRPIVQQGAEPQHDKLHSRLVPAILVEITVGPAGKFASSYGVVPLVRFTSESRSAKTSIRRTCDVVFPEHVTFPLKQRLAIHGATVDKSLPAPHVTEDDDGK